MTDRATALLVVAAMIAILAAALWVGPADVTGFWATRSGDIYAVSGDRRGNLRVTAPNAATFPVRIGMGRRLMAPPTSLGLLSLNGRRIYWRGGPVWYRQGV